MPRASVHTLPTVVATHKPPIITVAIAYEPPIIPTVQEFPTVSVTHEVSLLLHAAASQPYRPKYDISCRISIC